MGLGRVEPHNEGETFCMTLLGLKLSRRANAVSALHGQVSRRMWAHLWPWRVEEEIPIGHITNGVHLPSWLAWAAPVAAAWVWAAALFLWRLGTRHYQGGGG